MTGEAGEGGVTVAEWWVLGGQGTGGSGRAVRCEELYGLEEAECLVCLSAVKNVVLLPCRHVAVCEACLAGFQQHKCPVCRTPLDDYCAWVGGREELEKPRVEEAKEAGKED